MGVRGTIWRSGAAIALIGLAPALAFAHAGERGFVLLMPRGYALWGGTLAVAASFLVLLAIPEGPIRRFAAAELRLDRLPTTAAPWLSALSFALTVALIVVSGVVTSVQAIASAQDADTIGVATGLLSPWSIYSGLADTWRAGVVTFTPPGSAWALAYVLVAVVLTALCVLGLVARFRKVGSR